MEKRYSLQRPISRRGFVAAAAQAPILLSLGCSLPGSGPPPRRVRLSPAEEFPPNIPSVGWTLQVNEPTATLSLNTGRIAWIRTSKDVQFLATGEWASRAPEMVMELLVESFQNSGKILSVGDRRARIRPDFQLDSDLTEFHVEDKPEPGEGVVDVALNVRLIQMPRRRVVSTFSFSSSTDADPKSLESIIDGFNESLTNVMVDVVEWTLKTGAAAGSAS